jgi:hypothetical protein
VNRAILRKQGKLAWWCAPQIPALRWLRQEDKKFKTSLGYIAEILSKKKKKNF